MASLIYADADQAKKAEEIACDLAETLAEEITPYEEAFACEITSEENREADAVSGEMRRRLSQPCILRPMAYRAGT